MRPEGAASPITRRNLLGLGAAGAVGAFGLTGCGTAKAGSDGSSGKGKGSSGGSGNSKHAKPIGDGSTEDTGLQPHQPIVGRMEPGETPPQFVVFSWDGAGELDDRLFSRFRKLAQQHNASMTFFLSGIYCLPEGKKHLYHPPKNPVGASAIGYLKDEHIRATLEQVRLAWLEGHEIGTHFNGHFCDGSGSVANWTPADWRSEIEQAVDFVTKWRTNTGFHDLDPLPFDYRKELVGGRTPCLLGQENLLPTAAKLGWRYDASSPGGLQMWPTKKNGLWNYPLQSIPFPGRSFQVLSMDYNMLANQSQNATQSDPSNYPGWRKQARDAYVAGFQRAYETNRAPLFIGNHFENWNGGLYMDAVEAALKRIADHKDVRLVSFRQFTDWVEAQDPKTVEKLRALEVGQAPSGGWKSYLTA